MRLALIAPGAEAFRSLAAVLAEAGLPTDDLEAQPVAYYRLEGAEAYGGLVPLGEEALVRSVIVAPDARGAGHGAAMVEALCKRAAAGGARRLWLLTETAEAFFARLGWQTIEREAAPACVAASRQFAVTCPKTAVLMCRTLV